MTILVLYAGQESYKMRQFENWLGKPVPLHHCRTAAPARVPGRRTTVRHPLSGSAGVRPRALET
jgi:hypothetical protein